MLLGDGSSPFNVSITARLNGTFTKDSLTYALKTLQLKHPWLNAFVTFHEPMPPRFKVDKKQRTKIPLRVVERNTENDWQQETLKELSTPFAVSEEPLIRLVWVKGVVSSELMIVFHHCLCDGGAGIVLLKELLQVLDNADAEIGVEKPILSVADIIPQGILNSKRKQFKAALIGKLLTAVLAIVPVKKKAVNRKRDYFIHWKLEQDVSTSLIQLSKNEGITVNTLLCAIVLSAFEQVLKEKAHNKISCPVDIRRFATKIKEDQLFAYGLMFVASARPGLHLLNNARVMQKDIDKKIAKLDPYSTIMMMEAAHPSLNNFTNFLKYGKSTNDCMFSNLGKIAIPHQYQSFEVETIYSPAVIGPLGNTTTLLTSTYRGQMDFSFIASEGYLAFKNALAIKEIINKTIQELTLAALQPLTISA